MSKKNKKIVTAEKASGIKTPHNTVNPDSFLSKHPVWRFEKVDSGGKWDLYSSDILADILKKLVDFERMTWAEIQRQTHNDNRSSNHYISFEKMSQNAKDRFSELRLNEFSDNIFSLRLKSKERMFGILTDGIFYILWYDKNHEICPSTLKNT